MKHFILASLGLFIAAFGYSAVAEDPCELLAAKVSKTNALPGAIVRVNDRITDGLKNDLPYLSAYVSPGGFFEGGTGIASGGLLEILETPKRHGSFTAIKVRVQENGKIGYVYWNEFRFSTTLIKTGEAPSAAPKVARPAKLQFPYKFNAKNWGSGLSSSGFAFAEVGDLVYVHNLPRLMSPKSVGRVVELRRLDAREPAQAIATIKLLNGETTEVTLWYCNRMDPKATALFVAEYPDVSLLSEADITHEP